MSPAGTNALSQASIPMWPVGSTLLSVCVLKSLSGWLCLACYKQLPLLCPRDGWTLAWMLIGSLGFHSTFPTLSSSLSGRNWIHSFLCVSIQSVFNFFSFCSVQNFSYASAIWIPDISVFYCITWKCGTTFYWDIHLLTTCVWIRMLMVRKLIDWLWFWSCCCQFLQIMREGNQFFRAAGS